MRRRYKVLITLLAIAAAGLGAHHIASFDPDAPRRDWPALQAAKPSQRRNGVTIGPNVQVSQADDIATYWECVLSADGSDPARLIAAAISRKQPETDIVGFYSHDGGASWTPSFQQICPTGHQLFDPTIAFGTDGSAYLAFMDVTTTSPGERRAGSLAFLASADGRQSWEKRIEYPQFVDRPWLVVDKSSAPSSGNVYCIGQVERSEAREPSYAEPLFFRSSDELNTLSPPILPHTGRRMVNCRPANPVVFADGTLLLATQDKYVRHKIEFPLPRPIINTSRSTDGGRTFTDASPVNTQWWHNSIESAISSVVGAEFPQLAVDASNGESRDRVYCVWTDSRGRGSADANDGTRIFFSASSDYGATWSQAVVLSEQPMDIQGDTEFGAFVPSIAVNNHGTVAVAWYDRRGLPKTQQFPIDGNPSAFTTRSNGWNFRVKASVDGGRTWMPSVKVNEKPGVGDVFVGHTAGLVAAADGRFHAAWIDNRTGRNNLWTAWIEIAEE